MVDQRIQRSALRMAPVLPPPSTDLRPLIDFLALDVRPTAVFRHTDDADDGRQELVYGNPAFLQCLPDLEFDAVPFQSAGPICEDGEQKHLSLSTEVLARMGWEVRVSGKYRIALTTAPPRDPQHPETETDAHAPTEPHTNARTWDVKATPHVENEHLAVADGGPVTEASQDWTLSTVLNPSPWIAFLRSFDWASTGVGRMESWSPVLRQHVLYIMANPHPRTLIWGDDMTYIYNEACAHIFGSKHPEFMGTNASVSWRSVWDRAGPIIESAYRGRAGDIKDFFLITDRHGVWEDTYWSVTSVPILGAAGAPVGVLSEFYETSMMVTGDRRRKTLGQMNKSMAAASALTELWPAVLHGLETNSADFPFCMLYAVEDDLPDLEPDAMVEHSSSHSKPQKCVLAGTVGVPQHHPDAVQTISLTADSEQALGLTQTVYQVWKTRNTIKICPEDGTLPLNLAASIPGRSLEDPIRKALVSPIIAAGTNDILAVLVLAINPRCVVNAEYNLFIQLAMDFIEKAAALISLPQEQRRAKKMADDANNALAQQLRITTLEAQRSEARFSTLADTAPTGMYMFAPDGHALYVNDAYLKMFGHTREQAANNQFETSNWQSVIHEEDLPNFLGAWDYILEQKLPVNIEYRVKKPYVSVDKVTGQEIAGETWYLANAFPEIDADGNIVTVQGWLTDISHRKFSETLTAQRLEDALETKRQSENFIDMTSHEMRNPLSAILQSADSIVAALHVPRDTLDKTGDAAFFATSADEIMDATQTIILCAQHQKRIVDDILTLSKLDASLLIISPDKVQPPALVSQALKMYEAEITRAGIRVQTNVEPTYRDLDIEWVLLDPSRLLQVIINLLTNAIKFTRYSQVREITISLDASLEKPSGKHPGISFIAPRHVRHSAPAQSDPSRDDDIYIQFAITDTGRGLSADEMKILFQRFQQASPKTYKQYGGSGLGLFISRELCELQGGQIGVASGNGLTTFAFFIRAKRWASDGGTHAPEKPRLPRHISAPAMSIGFKPRANGFPVDAARVPIAETLSEHGSVKPDSKLPRSIERTHSAVETVTRASVTRLPSLDELHVLIVEDNLINQKVMAQQLRKAGCTVHLANDGLECLKFLECSTFCSGQLDLSVILLDLEMPIMDGLTCIRHIRQRQLSRHISSHIPVIAVTANARSEQIAIAIDAGMDQVITKPFRIAELVPQMRNLVAEIARMTVDVT